MWNRAYALVCMAVVLGCCLYAAAQPSLAQVATSHGNSTAKLRIRVIDDDRQEPLAKALVSATLGPDAVDWGLRGVSGADGRLELEVPAATQINLTSSWVTFRSLYDQQIAPLAPGETRELTVQLPTRFDNEIHLRVIDAESGLPMSDARATTLTSLAHFPSIAHGTRRAPSAVSNADGRFSLQFPSRHPLLARVHVPGYGPVDFRLARGISSSERPLLLRMSRSAALVIRMAEGGKLEAGAEVVAVPSTYQEWVQPRGIHDHSTLELAPGSHEWRATVSARSAVLRALPTLVRLSVHVEHGGQRQTWCGDVRLVAGQDGVITCRTPAPAEVRKVGRIVGRLLDEQGRALVRQELMLVPAHNQESQQYLTSNVEPAPRTAKTDANGNFVFTGVRPGNWWVGPLPRGIWATGIEDSIAEDPAALAPLAQRVEVQEAQSVSVALRRARGLYMRGRLLDSRNAPLANVQVYASVSDSMLTLLTTQTAADGSFVFGPIDRHGEVTFQAEVTLESRERAVPGGPDVLLRRKDVTLDATPRQPLQRVRIVDDVTGAEVFAAIEIAYGGDRYRGSRRFMADGSFAQRLEPGRNVLVARTAAGGFVQQEVRPDAGVPPPLELRVLPGVRLSLRYTNGPGVSQVKLISQDTPKKYVGLDDSIYGSEYIVVAPGRYLVRFLGAGNRVLFESPLLLAAGEREFLVDVQQRTLRAMP